MAGSGRGGAAGEDRFLTGAARWTLTLTLPSPSGRGDSALTLTLSLRERGFAPPPRLPVTHGERELHLHAARFQTEEVSSRLGPVHTIGPLPHGRGSLANPPSP